MRLTLRTKLMAVVGTAALAFVVLIVIISLLGNRAERQLATIQTRYLPKVELEPQLDGQFERLRHGLQDAVAAHDAEMLLATREAKNLFLEQLAAAREAVDPTDAAALRAAVEDYYSTAYDLSRRLIAGETGETLVDSMSIMQSKQARAGELLKRTTAFDRAAMTEAFAAATQSQVTAGRVGLIIGVVCLVSVMLLSLWISRGVLRSLSSLTAGLQRFGAGDFAQPITVLSHDELGDVGRQANQMADSLARLGEERDRTSWLKSGEAGLAQELGGQLEPAEVADRGVAFLARYLDAPAAALYHCDEDGALRLLGRYALSGDAPARFRLGEGLVGQAALQTDIMVVTDVPVDFLRVRTGLGEAAACSIVLMPLVHLGAVTGVLELATFKPWSKIATELLRSVRETLATAIEVARARSAMRELLEETQRQAEKLSAQEEELRAANEEMQTQQVELEQKAKELTTASAYKSQFLASMSHELRTPLNAIIGFTELLYDGVVPADSPQHKEFLGDVLTSGRHLLQLISDVLDLSKVEAGKLELWPEPVNLPALVGEVLAILRVAASAKRIRVDSDVDRGLDELILDPARVKQVLYNYLSNALKFTPEGGRVAIRALPDGDAHFRIEVEDTGTGIAPEDMGRLFGEFQQIGEGAKQVGGTGLGLALTKRLVEAQGGRVGVRSTPGVGSVFSARLPRRLVTSAARPPAPASVSRPDAPAVLVIEDNPIDQRELVDVLSAAGYAIEVATTGSQALAKCRAQAFDAVTLDLLLPDMSGLDLLRQIRADGQNRDVPVVVITVVTEPGSVAGFAVQDILAKPLDSELLLHTLSRAGVAPDRPGGVLVVDDDGPSLKLMATTLGQFGYETRCERDGESALRAARGVPPSAVVLDLMMPGMNGFEFLDRFREAPEARHIPVIIWTMKDLTADEHALLRASAQAVVSKGHGGTAAVLAELQTFLKVAWRESR